MLTRNLELVNKGHSIPCKIYLPQEPVRRVVLGVHGFAGDKESSVLRALARALTREGGALVCFDFPAHGHSLADDRLLQVEVCKADLLCVAEFVRRNYPQAELGLFATSFGGYIALLCQDALQDFRQVLRAPALEMARSFAGCLPCSLEEFRSHGSVWFGYDRKMEVSWAFYQELLAQPAPAPNRPTLLLQGTEDEVVSFDTAQALAQGCPHVTLLPLEGADHRLHSAGERAMVVDAAMQWYGTGSLAM